MKILIPAIHYYPVVGGIETWTRHIAEIISQKADVFVVTGKVRNQPNQTQSGGLKIVRTSLFALKNLSHSPLVYTLSLLPFLFFRSLALIKKEKVNVVHCQGFLSSFLGFLLLKLTGVPYIVTVQRMEAKRNPLKKFIYRQAAVCIGASWAIGKYFREIGCKNIEVIPNGINLERFGNLGRKLHTGFIVTTAARLEKVKGIEYLIRAVKDFQLLIIGDGSERKNLESLVEKLNLKDKVKFLGEIPNEKIPEYLAVADCFVMPSIREGFGIAILEAQAAGVPVIGTRIGGILDLIEDGRTGLLVEPKNALQIQEAIIKIQSEPGLSKILVENAKENLIKYDWQNIAEKVYSEYNSIYRAIKSHAMKFILATPIYPPEIGGPAIYAKNLKEGLEKDGNAVRTVSYWGLKKYFQPIRIFLYFLRLFRNTKGCNLIYAFNLTSCGLPACLTSKILRKRFLIRVGGDFLWERAVEARRTQKPLLEYHQDKKTLKEKFWILLIKKVFSRADKIIFTSDFQKDIYLKHFNIKKEKTIVVPNPFPEINPSVQGIPTAKRQILYAGRLIKLKNLGRLIDAFGKVLSKTDKPLILKIIGEGPEKQHLELKIKDLGLADKITIEKPLLQPELWQEIQRSYLCVLPSLTEITPNFALECIKLSKPILLTRETGLADGLKDGLIFLDPQNSQDLEEKILYLLNEANYADYLERIKKIPTDWSWNQVVQEHLKLFKNLT